MIKFSGKRYTAIILFFIITAIAYNCKALYHGSAKIKKIKSASARPDTVPRPEENRFTKVILSDDLNEPMDLAVAPDGDFFFVERAGNFYRYDHNTHKTILVYKFPVTALEALNGLLGIAIDPDFSHNRFIYFYHTLHEGKQLIQHLSRFTLNADKTLDLASEKIMLKVPIDESGRTHTGGSMDWDKYKNLYISTGDNTSPSESDGYGPIDERPNRLGFDAQRSAGNTNDLRGKILRIHPETNGTYTIPKGNLFPPGEEKTRPEIYVMGCRNPYRIGVDPVTSILYWGEVGPDASVSGKRGSRGYDEFNQAKKAGNFGWPYFVGDNQPYARFNFATNVIGELFDPAHPVNNSINNTGLVNLPPAQKAMVWYPYSETPLFPLMGSGGRAAMGGPVYHYNPALKSKIKFPEYYDKALFMFEWMRKLVLAIRLNQDNDYKSMELFMPATGNFIRPIDMHFGPDGALYVLEYGTVYSADNPDARLIRVEYNAGNRAPVAHITTADTIGRIPLKVTFNSSKSFDFDKGDKITYQWQFGNGVTSASPNPVYTYKRNGIYKVTLKVTDRRGESSRDTKIIKVGNTPPRVAIHVKGNRTFFFPGVNLIKYNVTVADDEDKIITKKNVKVKLDYLADSETNQDSQSSSGSLDPEFLSTGKELLAKNDCKACHQENKKVVGPAFMDVAKKYKNDNTAVSRLANKVITGGSGVWGNEAMSAHPQLAQDDAMKIVKYVLSLSKQYAPVKLPQQGTATLKDHISEPNTGRYILTASYTDRGGAITPLTTTAQFVLRPALILAGSADSISHMVKQETYLNKIIDQSFFTLKNIDLTGINKLAYNYSSLNVGATIEVRLDSLKGTLVSTAKYQPTGSWTKFTEVSAPVTATNGKHDIYFVFKDDNHSMRKTICKLNWVQFKH